MKPLLLFGGIALAGTVTALASAKPKPKPAAAIPPSDLMARATAAIQAGDSAELRRIAAELRRKGYETQADELDTVADGIDSLPSGIDVPTIDPGQVGLPGIGGTTRPVDLSVLAQEVANQARAGQDDGLVTVFQEATGLNPDGLYGLQTGLRVADQGVVPPSPLHWGTHSGGWESVEREQREWRSQMLSRALTDPARAGQWQAAAETV